MEFRDTHLFIFSLGIETGGIKLNEMHSRDFFRRNMPVIRLKRENRIAFERLTDEQQLQTSSSIARNLSSRMQLFSRLSPSVFHFVR